MTRFAAVLEATRSRARAFLRAPSRYRKADLAQVCRDFATTLDALCAVGVRCDRHGGVIHGQEAEELRAGVEQILDNTCAVSTQDAAFVLDALRKALLCLLDRTDARDSLAFREATNSDGAGAAVPLARSVR